MPSRKVSVSRVNSLDSTIDTKRYALSIRQITAVTGKPVGPGESAAPALAVVLDVRVPAGGPAVATGALSVTATDADGAPGLALTGRPAAPFSPTIKAGSSDTGTFVFAVPRSSRQKITVLVNDATAAATYRFAGSVS